jgi:hypothetical protein
MHTAIRATSLTLAQVISNGIAADTELGPLFDFGGGTMRVVLNTPEEMQENSIQGVSLWLYRVIRDDQRLNAPPQRVTPRQLQPTPLPVRLHYLVTPVVDIDPTDPSASAERAQTLLGKVMQSLYVKPVLRGSDLQNTLAGSSAEIGVRLESHSMDELSRIWTALKRSYALSVSYEAAVVNIDPDVQPVSVTPVHAVVPQYSVVITKEPA